MSNIFSSIFQLGVNNHFLFTKTGRDQVEVLALGSNLNSLLVILLSNSIALKTTFPRRLGLGYSNTIVVEEAYITLHILRQLQCSRTSEQYYPGEMYDVVVCAH